jgi:hypothetical protein
VELGLAWGQEPNRAMVASQPPELAAALWRPGLALWRPGLVAWRPALVAW